MRHATVYGPTSRELVRRAMLLMLAVSVLSAIHLTLVLPGNLGRKLFGIWLWIPLWYVLGMLAMGGSKNARVGFALFLWLYFAFSIATVVQSLMLAPTGLGMLLTIAPGAIRTIASGLALWWIHDAKGVWPGNYR